MREVVNAYPSSLSQPMNPVLSGISYCDATYSINRIDSPFTVIEYIYKGCGNVTVNGEIFTASEDQIYILPKGSTHYYTSDADNPWTKVFINIEGEFPLHMIKEYGLSGLYLFNCKQLKHVFDDIKMMSEIKESTPDTQIRLMIMFTEIILILSHESKEIGHSEEAVSMKKYLDNNTNRIVSNEELSSLIFRKPDYCIKLFNKEYHITPYSYQLSKKICNAKQLLRTTNIPVAEISEMIGYADSHYFSSIFKNKTGVSPLKYRKTYNSLF